MSKTVIILKKSALDELRRNITKNIDRYQSEKPNWEEFFEVEEYTRATHVEIIGDNFGEMS